jgi:two-component sensor histidine kinase
MGRSSGQPEKGEIDMLPAMGYTDDIITAISLVHEMLYKSHNLSYISINSYIKELADLFGRVRSL